MFLQKKIKQNKRKNAGIIRKIMVLVLAFLMVFEPVANAGLVTAYAEPDPFRGFPESYKPYLQALAAKYPNWTFVPDVINMDFADAVEIQYKNHNSLVSSDSPSSWKSPEESEFDFAKNRWIGRDGDNWVAASREIIAYYMDPRNQMAVDENVPSKRIFQFLGTEYIENIQTPENLAKILKDSFLADPVIQPTVSLSTAAFLQMPVFLLQPVKHAGGRKP